MNLFLSILNFLFVIIGITAVLRFAVWKLTNSGKTDYHYITLLKDQNAEMTLREIIQKNKYEFDSGEKIIFAVDIGLDEETKSVCELISYYNPQIVFCQPEELAYLVK